MHKLLGPDTSVETSLKDYGIAWHETSAEYKFYYGVLFSEEALEFIKFACVRLRKDVDLKRELDWVGWDTFFEYLGIDDSAAYFENTPTTWIIYELTQYYGYEEIFGLSPTDFLTYEDIISK